MPISNELPGRALPAKVFFQRRDQAVDCVFRGHHIHFQSGLLRRLGGDGTGQLEKIF